MTMGYGAPYPGYGVPPPQLGPVRVMGTTIVAIVLVLDAILNFSCATCVFTATNMLGGLFMMAEQGDIIMLFYGLAALYVCIGAIQLLVGFAVWTMKPWAWLASVIVLLLSIVMHGIGLMIGNVVAALLIIIEVIALVFLFTSDTKYNIQSGGKEQPPMMPYYAYQPPPYGYPPPQQYPPQYPPYGPPPPQPPYY